MTTLAETGSVDLSSAVRGAMAVGDRPQPVSAARASMILGWRALLKIKHVPEQLFDVLFTPIIFTLMFTYLFGGALAGSTSSYLQFVLPGILVQSVIFTTVYTGVTLNTDISKGVFDRFRSLPIWRPAPLVGALLGDAVRYCLASSVVVIFGLVLGFRPDGGPAGVLLAVALLLVFAFGIGWCFTTLGLLMRTPNSVMAVSMMVLMPLTFLTNIFVDPATMPEVLQYFVASNPVTHLVTAVRGLMAGTPQLVDIGLALATPALLTVVFGPLAAMLYRNKA